MRDGLVVLCVGCLLVGSGMLPSWGEVTSEHTPGTSDLSAGDSVSGDLGLSRLTLYLFAKQADSYDGGTDQDTTDELSTDDEPSWLELYLALGGIILVSLGIVRLAEARRLDDPCFIATAAWGTPLAREVNMLRHWRDKYLLTSVAGVAFVDIYYRLSPAIAEQVARSPWLAFLTRLMLFPVLLLSDGILLAAVVFPVLLLVTTGIGLAWWFRRRKRHASPRPGASYKTSPGSR
ncbi:MAG TPA: hypothetical protein PK379_02695 [Candidatus Hydrogenedentes bacterium]|nr:hypothetical protein [Candidatus Hydrogenedentota bacterium]HOK88913.1 hypothetical protein [Candidatus Hydrogenedentota bacterium]